MNRTLMRENAFRLLYSLEVQKNKEINVEEQIELYIESNNITNTEAIIQSLEKTVPNIHIIYSLKTVSMKCPRADSLHCLQICLHLFRNLKVRLMI